MSTDTNPMSNEASPAEAALLAGLLLSAWEAIRGDKDIGPFSRIDALNSRIPDLIETAMTLRMALTLIDSPSHPDEVRRRAALAEASKAAEAARQAARSAAVERSIDKKTAAEALARAEAEHVKAQQVAGRIASDPDASDRDQVLAAGAVHGAEQAMIAARAKLASLSKGGAK